MIKAKKKSLTRYKGRTAVGVAKIFDWGRGPNRKSHAMTSSKFFEKWLFMGQKYPKMEDQKSSPGLACNLDFAKGKGFEPKVKKCPQLFKFRDVVSRFV